MPNEFSVRKKWLESYPLGGGGVGTFHTDFLNLPKCGFEFQKFAPFFFYPLFFGSRTASLFCCVVVLHMRGSTLRLDRGDSSLFLVGTQPAHLPPQYQSLVALG